MRRFLVIRQGDDGNLYGRPEMVKVQTLEGPQGEPGLRLEYVLGKVFGKDAPLDSRLDRALVFELKGPGTGVPVIVHRPHWSKERTEIG